MIRRRYLTALSASVSAFAMAGCSGGNESSDDNTAEDDNGGGSDSDSTSDATQIPDVDTGIVYDGDLSNFREWFVEVSQSQSVTVNASDIGEGEYLLFQVGDGISFVHSYRFYEQDSGTTNEYQFESDGRHQLQLRPERSEAPVNEEVTVSVTMELSEP